MNGSPYLLNIEPFFIDTNLTLKAAAKSKLAWVKNQRVRGKGRRVKLFTRGGVLVVGALLM
jgi:hypothetical protein